MFKDNPKLKNIFWVSFLFYLQFALTLFFNSSFLLLFLKEKHVGLLYTLGFVISIIVLLVIPKVLTRIGDYKFLLWAAGLNAISLLLLSVAQSIWLIVPIFVLYLTLNIVIVFSLDELLQIASKNSEVGEIRGFYIVIMHVAFILTQIVSGIILNNFSFSLLYLIAFVSMSLFFVVSFFSLRGMPDPEYDKMPILESLKTFFQNKNLIRSWKINFLLRFFYAFMIVYTPLYLNTHLGFTWSEVGIIFTIMLTPFLVLPFFLGEYSDKIGERKMLMLGFIIMSLTTLTLFFIKQPEVWIWALLLFTTRIGASTVEIMSDAYFFKHITSANDEFISIYRNADPAAFTLAPLAVFLILIFAPSLNFIFLALGAVMFYGIYLAATIERSDI